MINVLISIVVLIVILLIVNYWAGKKFHPCSDCDSNIIYKVTNITTPPNIILEELEDSIRQKGSVLNPKYNFGNSMGKKANYKQIPQSIKDFYENMHIDKICSNVVGKKLSLANDSEEYRIFARLYEDEDDFLDWHYDNNFTIAQRYTLVVPVLVDECNTAEFEIKDRKTQVEKIIEINLGEGVIYNGSEVYHKITKQTQGCKRMVVIFPMYENYNMTLFGKMRKFMRSVVYQNLKL